MPGGGVDLDSSNPEVPNWNLRCEPIEEFDSYERILRLESGCWSTRRATDHATQPRKLRPNTRVETMAVPDGPEPAAGKSRRNERGLSANESDPGFLERHHRSRI